MTKPIPEKPTIWQDFVDSFRPNRGGFCPKRTSGFAVLVVILAMHPFFVDKSNWEMTLIADLGFVATCFGISSFADQKKLGLGYNGDNTPVEPTVKSIITTSDTVSTPNTETTTSSTVESTNIPK